MATNNTAVHMTGMSAKTTSFACRVLICGLGKLPATSMVHQPHVLCICLVTSTAILSLPGCNSRSVDKMPIKVQLLVTWIFLQYVWHTESGCCRCLYCNISLGTTLPTQRGRGSLVHRNLLFGGISETWIWLVECYL